MTLESSGTLYLVGSSGAPTRSIQYELEGVYTGIGLIEARNLAGWSGTVAITDFYGYSACSETIPAVPTGVSANWLGPIPAGVVQIYFNKPSNADGMNFERSVNNSVWDYFYDNYVGTSPFTSSCSCAYYYFRAAGYNCAGEGTFSSGYYATGTCS